MTSVRLTNSSLLALQDKVVVLTGSAHGIGASTVSLLHSYGAKVIHGDWDAVSGEAVNSSLPSGPLKGESTFVKTDVCAYDSILNLFHVAWRKYGRVDIAISNAGVTEGEDWFDAKLDLESIKRKPSAKVLDVNFTGSLYFARIACVYLSQPQTSSSSPTSIPGPENFEKSLVLVSSAAGFKESPGLPTYTATKHGILGLMRSLRPVLPKTHGISVNAICPWMTDTGMCTGIRENWVKEALPVNQPQDVANIMVEVAVGRDKGERWNGRAVFVEGGRGWDIEEGIDATEELWLGKEVSRTLARGQEVLGDGTDWAG